MAKPEVLKATPVKGKGMSVNICLSNKPTHFVPRHRVSSVYKTATHFLCIHPEKFCANVSILTKSLY